MKSGIAEAKGFKLLDETERKFVFLQLNDPNSTVNSFKRTHKR